MMLAMPRSSAKLFRPLYVGEWVARSGRQQEDIADATGITDAYLSELMSACSHHLGSRTMSTTSNDNVTPFPPAKSNNPFDVFHAEAIKALSELKVPGALASYPMPREFLAVRDYMQGFASIMDELLANVGHQVKHTASHNVDIKLFEGAFASAIDGNATYECEAAAQQALADFSAEELA
jgi:hypothetical protein